MTFSVGPLSPDRFYLQAGYDYQIVRSAQHDQRNPLSAVTQLHPEPVAASVIFFDAPCQMFDQSHRLTELHPPRIMLSRLHLPDGRLILRALWTHSLHALARSVYISGSCGLPEAARSSAFVPATVSVSPLSWLVS